ncbi:MAG TPA: Mur ligase family protein [Afifellaceae bacterium]|nr:Mur ligase family protein [Afifellaceae bacterium]
MSALWRLADLVAAIGGQVSGSPAEAVTGISIDSRTLQPGEAFFAIRGDRFDGHDFVDKAIEAGAALAVVGADWAAGAGRGSLPLVAVGDGPLAALERLAAARRTRSGAAIAAITGSVGKTGTKEMLRAALAGQGLVHAAVGSFNNHWGVPLSLARMPADARFAIFEIGMNHAGEIRPLTGVVRPHVAIVTTVEAVHTEFFASVEEIAEAKAEIFDGLEAGGTAILNRDNQWYDLLRARARERGARIVGLGVRPEADLTGAVAALAGFRPPAGRGERFVLKHRGGAFILIDESYNANPASMSAALALLGQARPGPSGRRIAVLGDMLELGAEAERLHASLLDPLRQAEADLVFLAGPLMKSLWRALPESCRGAYCETADALAPILCEQVRQGDVVMVKASAGTRLKPLVEEMRRRFAPEVHAA